MYLGNTIGARAGAVNSVTTRIRGRCCKFGDFVPMLASKGLPLGVKGRL